MTRVELLKMVTALAGIGNRTLPTINNDLRVARLLRLLKPEAEDIDKARAKLVAEATQRASKTEDVAEQNAINAQLIVDVNAFFSEPAEAVLPSEDKRIHESDLPKDRAGTEGPDNRKSLATLIADLGDMYIFTD